MKSNRVPLIIPCHRVVAAGDLGGYSAPQGIELKKRLLQMEAELSEPDAK
jgi:methylated-DNA-[protein]-cysteine S-methyltransferase